MANTKISALTANTNPNGNEEFVYAYNNANGKISLNTMKTFASSDSQPTLVSGVNIKTINSQSILGSGNIDVSGGGGGGWSPTELGGDANIWELSDGVYITEYMLYYISGEEIPSVSNSGGTKKQMLFVSTEDSGAKGFFVYSISDRMFGSEHGYTPRACYGYSVSASKGECNILGDREWTFNQYRPVQGSGGIDNIDGSIITQLVSSISGTNNLTISTSNPPYAGITYTIYITSVASSYSVGLGTGVTNPLGITLPTNSNKTCVITVLTTSTTTGIVTGCTIAN